MPVTKFAYRKGGAGDATTELILADQLAEKAASVTLIGTDPERWNSQWRALPGEPDSTTTIGGLIGQSAAEQID